MANNTITFKRLYQRFDKLSQNVQVQVKAEIDVAAQNIINNAKMEAPVDTGTLRNSLIVDRQAKSVGVVAQTFYAPYQDFGTGTGVSIPPELSKYANQFRGRGGRNPNIKGKGFLWGNLFDELPKLRERIKKAIFRK